MEATVKLVSGLLVIPAAAAAGAYFAYHLVAQTFCRLVALVIEQALAVVLRFCEFLVSQLDGLVTNTVLP